MNKHQQAAFACLAHTAPADHSRKQALTFALHFAHIADHSSFATSPLDEIHAKPSSISSTSTNVDVVFGGGGGGGGPPPPPTLPARGSNACSARYFRPPAKRLPGKSVVACGGALGCLGFRASRLPFRFFFAMIGLFEFAGLDAPAHGSSPWVHPTIERCAVDCAQHSGVRTGARSVSWKRFRECERCALSARGLANRTAISGP